MSRSDIVDKSGGASPPKVVEYKAGDKVRVIGNTNGHGYNIGEVVTLVRRMETPSGHYFYWHTKERLSKSCVKESDMELEVEDTSKPKSEWFGYKYRVTPETSKLLQEAVFKGGGGWKGLLKTEVGITGATYLFVDEDGELSHQGCDTDYFNRHRLPEKQPPSVDKQDEVSVEYKTYREQELERFLKVELTLNKQSSNFNQQEETKMSNANRRVVNVRLLDNDPGLPVEYSLVAEYTGIVTEDSNDIVIQQILMDEDVKEAVEQHNINRTDEIDLEILKRTGNKVNLQPVKLKQLTWVVTQA